jgi:anaerobic selenocysteine-containing dehydrogenase/Fe-S-cluster-containing dehydrogenase component
MKRRDFLKLTGISGALAAAGCAKESNNNLIPFLNPPEDILPGVATWFATTCRQCPAGCGLLAKNREARIVKLEGNPNHPVNLGKLCGRGQAGLQDLYSPDRLKQPRLLESGKKTEIDWDQALSILREKATEAGSKIALLSGLENGYASETLSSWLTAQGSDKLHYYEPINYEALREGNRLVFGNDTIPSIDISSSDFILSAGVDFIETWLSPVELTRQFTQAREYHGTNAGFVYAGPRLSLTAVPADRWIEVRPGAQADFLFALLAVLVETTASKSGSDSTIKAALEGLNAEELAKRSEVDSSLIHALAERIAHAKTPVVLADDDPNAVVAANLINLWTGSAGTCFDFSRPMAISLAAKSSDLEALMAEMIAGDIKMLVVHRSNPAFALPGFVEAMSKVPFVAAIDSVKTETVAGAHLTLPVATPYESWGAYSPRTGLTGLMQPTMGPVVPAAPLEIILSIGEKTPDLKRLHFEFAKFIPSALGLSEEGYSAPLRNLIAAGFSNENDLPTGDLKLSSNFGGFKYEPKEVPTGLSLLVYPSLRWFDGRDANKTWMLETPDPLTNITWDTWVEMHPETAAAKGIEDGDTIQISVDGHREKFGVHLYPGLHKSAIAVPIGLGRGYAGRYVRGLGANPLQLSGGPGTVSGISITRTDRAVKFAHTDGSKSQHGRAIVRVKDESGHGDHGEGHSGHPVLPLRIPTAEHHDPKLDMYPPIKHKGYRWGMVIDLDKCNGCSACVAACYAENNINMVGKQRIAEGREMSWIHIERYFEPGDKTRIVMMPMPCQHCNNAPCEAVCPVYAPHHNSEGINTQIYNRCVGTRYCSQNCPYKVRRFNWFTYKRDKPLDLQLNPDVTVRTMGVMEKCSFCIQRIKEAHLNAKREDRTVKDGEVIPACVQTCPADAISFGSYLDPESKINKLIEADHDRAYQVLDELNTQPAVIYLKRVIRDDKLHKA